MGPLCSSAETQVCHRSYIIAARVNRDDEFELPLEKYGDLVLIRDSEAGNIGKQLWLRIPIGIT
jgi:hypothetical protein